MDMAREYVGEEGAEIVRALILLLLGGVLGAVLFHVYYLRLARESRCGWDHPLDQQAQARCRDAEVGEKARGYATKARRELDNLIGNVVQ